MSKSVQTIEKTSKPIKTWRLISTLGIIFSGYKIFVSSNTTATTHWILFALACMFVNDCCGFALRWWING